MRRLWMMGLSLLVACTAAGSENGYPTIVADGEPLRSAFDAAAGKVRAVFLAAPT